MTLLGVEVLLLGRSAWPPSRTNRRRIFIQHHRGGATWIVADSVRCQTGSPRWSGVPSGTASPPRGGQGADSLIEERLQIARELHDIIAHSLSVIAVQSAVGGHVSRTSPMRPESPWPLLKRRVARHWKNAWVGRSLASR